MSMYLVQAAMLTASTKALRPIAMPATPQTMLMEGSMVLLADPAIQPVPGNLLLSTIIFPHSN
jgi:hypothetical protein